MGLCADWLRGDSPVSDYVLGWSGDPRPQSDNVPLRLAGALHALRIEGLALEGIYPPQEVDDEALWAAVESTLLRFPKRIVLWLQSAPQTNEVLRAAVILPALALIEERFGRPLDLFELGASAGLNLYANQFHLPIPGATIGNSDATVRLNPDWSGPLPPTRLATVVSRRAVDLNPLDPTDPTDQLRLLAYLWPEQPDRMSRTRAAIGIAKVDPAKIDCGDAGDWLAEVLKPRPRQAVWSITPWLGSILRPRPAPKCARRLRMPDYARRMRRLSPICRWKRRAALMRWSNLKCGRVGLRDRLRMQIFMAVG